MITGALTPRLGRHSRVLLGNLGRVGLLVACVLGAPASFGDSSSITAQAPFQIVATGFEQPTGLVVHPAGDLFLTDRETGVLYRLTPGFTSSGKAAFATSVVFAGLDEPMGVTVEHNGGLLVAESDKGRLVRLAKLSDLVFSAVPVPVVDGLKEPRWLTVDGEGGIFVSAEGVKDKKLPNGQPKPKEEVLLKLAPDGTLSVVADRFEELGGVTIDAAGTLYAAAKRRKGDDEKRTGTIFKIHLPDGKVSTAIATGFKDPVDLKFDALGALFLTAKQGQEAGERGSESRDQDEDDDPSKGMILKATLKDDGTLKTLKAFASGLGAPTGLAFDQQGNLYSAAESRRGQVFRFQAPEPPALDPPLPPFTSQRTLTVHGKAEPNALITVLVMVKGDPSPFTGLADGSSGAFTIDVALTPNVEQKLQVFATGRGGDGLTSRATEATVTQDEIPPDTLITGCPSVPLTTFPVTFGFSGTDNITPPGQLLFASSLDGAPFSPFSRNSSLTFTTLAPGPHTLRVKAQDQAGNEDLTPAVCTFTVITGPIIGDFNPNSAPVGTAVTVTGNNFISPTGAGPQVTLNKQGGGSLGATVASFSATSIVFVIPTGAATGPITVTTPVGTATSAAAITVTKTQDFSLRLLPSLASVATTGSVTYQVQMTSTGPTAFTGFATVGLSGLPAGVTATVSPPQATVNTVTTVILNVASAAAGTYGLTLTGTAPVDGTTTSKTATATLTVLPAGTSTLSGRVLASKDDSPLANVTIKLGTRTVLTDASGNFLMDNVPVGPQIVFVDGATASSPTATYPIVPVPVTIVAGQDNVLPYPIFLHEVSLNFTPIDPTRDTIVTDPAIPGLSMRIPAGTQIIGWDGQPNTKVSVKAVPVTRSALAPIPPGLTVSTMYLFYFGKPGGGTPSRPIPVTAPNDLGVAPGTKVDLYFYDESLTPDPTSNQWKKFGTGTVSDDGLQVVSDPGVGIPKFCCGGWWFAPPPPPRPCADCGNSNTAGDPVILSTGQFTMEETDLVLPGRQPVVIKRAHQSPSPGFPLQTFSDVRGSGPFGTGTTLSPYDDTLRPLGPKVLAHVTQFGQALLSQQADGTYATTSFNFLRGVVATKNPDGTVQMRLKDGMALKFDASGNLVERRDRNGNAVTIVRDGSGRITAIKEPAGRALTFQYNGAGLISQVTDPIGRTVSYTYDAQNRLTQVTNPAGGTTSYTYSFGRILTITDPRGNTVLTNDYGNPNTCLGCPLFRQTHADGGVWTFSYTGSGGGYVSETVVTDSLGHKITHRFNGRGYEIATIDALGQKTQKIVDYGTGQLLEVIDPLSRSTKFTYDAAGNTTSITDPGGNITRFEYEPTFNRVTKITDALNQVTTFTYDANGNLLTTTDPLNHTTTIAYNSFGQLVSVADPLNNVTQFAYDDQGNLVATTDPLGNTTQRAYDAVSRLISLTDPRGFTTQFGYDPLNRVTQITDALNGLTQFAYDPNGNLLTLTDAKGQATSYTYDVQNRLLKRTDALNRSESFIYDFAGNLTRVTDRKGQFFNFTFDALNRRIGANYADGSSASFTYDSVGRLTAVTDSASGVIQNTYDNLNRLTQEITPQGAVSYAYDALGRRASMTPNGQHPVTYGYDTASRLTQVAQGSLTVDLGYDAAGRRTSLTYPNGTSATYSYDTASRLQNILHQGPAGMIESLTYTYDAGGNRINFTRVSSAATQLPAAVQAAYDATNEQIQFNNSTPNLTYDANGNLTSQTVAGGTTTYIWDVRDRLIGITGPGVNASFAYDGLNRRVSKTINGVRADYQFDRQDVIAEIASGALGATYLRGLSIDESFIRQSSSNEYYHLDALGSTLDLTDTTGAITTSYAYEAFGKTNILGASSNPFQYTGRENDGTGLYYYRARYYAPQFGRFLQEDPSGTRGGFNLYAYANGNPVSLRDSLGLEPILGYCGSGFFQRLVFPDTALGGVYSFGEACKKHDECYDTCGNSKAYCDAKFYLDLNGECQKLSGYWAKDCSISAVVYYSGVDQLADNAYNDAQRKACTQGPCQKNNTSNSQVITGSALPLPRVY